MANLKEMSKEQLIEYIKEQKSRLGSRLVMPAHHYQVQDVVELSDFRGDSYKLAVDCSKAEGEFILFCGVKFMAEGASILASSEQKVLIPDVLAGCPMANMIDEKLARGAYDKMSSLTTKAIAPIVYMNSYADMKSFCGEKGGTVCTSSNALKIVKHYLAQEKAIFFFPDYNLGINTASELNLTTDEVAKVKRDLTIEYTGDDYSKVKMFLWDGFCHVHKEFTVGDIEHLRTEDKDINIIVHPECDKEVVDNSDYSGSTQKIYNTIKDAADGSSWGVGTEYNFVARIAAEFPSKRVVPLRKSVCMNMEKITLLNVAECLQSIRGYIDEGTPLKNEIRVSSEYKENSKKALQTMIEIVES